MANETEIFDDGLKAMFGDRFHDMQDAGNTPVKPVAKPVDKTIAVDAPWDTTHENKHNSMRYNVIRSLIYAGLNILVFVWQEKTLMAPAAAIPCMWVLMCATGYHIGKAVTIGVSG